MRNLLQDVRYATRQFCKSPGFVVGAIVSLMLGIGASTTLFSVVYGVLLNPFPYRDANRIVYVRVSNKSGGYSELGVNGSQIEAVRKVSSVEDVFFQRAQSKTLTGEKYPIILNAGFFTSNAFDVLGVPPLLGRAFTQADARGNSAAVAVLSYRFWQEHYFKSHEVIGKTIELNQVPYTVIGVMPSRFTWLGSDVYLPEVPTADTWRSATGWNSRTIAEPEMARSTVAQAPGVEEAGLSPLWYPGLFAAWNASIEIKSKPTMTDAQAVILPVSPQLFSVLRIRLLRGRIFDGLEVQRQAHVAVVNQAFLKQYLGDVEPIGQHVRVPKQVYSSLSADDWMEVIGVVGDATNDSVEHPRVRPAIFVPSSFGNLAPGVLMFARASGDPEMAIRSVRARLRELAPDVVVIYARTLQSDLSWEWARERLITTILSLYGCVALILAATGLFSVVSFAVTQRTQELGIRIALGAGRGSVVRLILSSTAFMLGLGVLGGLILSAMLSPLVSTWGGGHLSQPLTLLEAALILVLVAAIACAVPAWRATSVDPIKVLLSE